MATYMNESIIIGSNERRGSRGGGGFALLVALVLGGVAAWFIAERGEAPSEPVLPIVATSTAPAHLVSSVKLAFLDGSGEGSGASAGCDNLEIVELPVTPTADPVGVALRALFDGATTTDLTPGNFVAGQESLTFVGAEDHEGDHHVNLEGSVSYAGVCDDPRLQIQIEETVRANRPAVGEVEIFLNGAAYEQPNEEGEE